MRIYPKTLRVFIVSVIAALAVAALFSFLLFMIERSAEEVRDLKAAQGREVVEEQQFLSQRILLQDTAGERGEIDRRFLAGDAVASFLERIEKLGEDTDTNVEVDSVGVRQSADENAVTETLDVSIEVTGSWGNVYHYLTLLESVPLSLTIEKSLLSVSGRTEEDESIWRGSFDITVGMLK